MWSALFFGSYHALCRKRSVATDATAELAVWCSRSHPSARDERPAQGEGDGKLERKRARDLAARERGPVLFLSNQGRTAPHGGKPQKQRGHAESPHWDSFRSKVASYRSGRALLHRFAEPPPGGSQVTAALPPGGSHGFGRAAPLPPGGGNCSDVCILSRREPTATTRRGKVGRHPEATVGCVLFGASPNGSHGLNWCCRQAFEVSGGTGGALQGTPASLPSPQISQKNFPHSLAIRAGILYNGIV